jgi:hypothetical protein
MNCSICGGHRVKNVEICPECGTPVDREQPASPVPSSAACPQCGKENPVRETFQCPGCRQNFLCLDHRIKNSKFDPDSGGFISEYYCTSCWKQLGFALISE